MEIIYGKEKKILIKALEEQYGIKELPFLLVHSGKEKIRGYSGNLSTDEISEIDQTAKIALIGLYLFHEFKGELRLSLDAIHILKDQISKNIIELDEKQAKAWLTGEDLMLDENLKKEKKGFKVIKFKDDFIGTGKLSIDRLINYLPKERRIKNKN